MVHAQILFGYTGQLEAVVHPERGGCWIAAPLPLTKIEI